MDFFNEMEPMLKTLWFIALPASLIFVIQTILTFVGMDSTDGIDADFDSNITDNDGPFQLFSLRNLINFLLGFSWGGISMYESISNKALLVILAALIGSAMVYMFFLIIKQLQKLQENNTFNISNALNKSATVYLTIPASKNGKGKVQVSVNNSIHEIDAITEGEKLETGTLVKIKDIVDKNLLIVEKI